MTELIVALDGLSPFACATALYCAEVPCWFKIGPQVMASPDWHNLIRTPGLWGRKIFLDLKLADTRNTIREAVKRFADIGVTAVSTFTVEATQAAVMASEGTPLRVWQVIKLTDTEYTEFGPRSSRCLSAHGVICPGALANLFIGAGIDVVVPGVRLAGEDGGGHYNPPTPSEVAAVGATHAVVGRPIWQAADPVAAAREFIAALA